MEFLPGTFGLDGGLGMFWRTRIVLCLSALLILFFWVRIDIGRRPSV